MGNDGIRQVELNREVPFSTLEEMISRIPYKDESSTLRRCRIAEHWIQNNDVISMEQFETLLAAIDSYRKPILDRQRKELKALKAEHQKRFESFVPVGSKEHPHPLRELHEQMHEADCYLADIDLETVSFEQAQYYDITIYRDKWGNLWESLYAVGD